MKSLACCLVLLVGLLAWVQAEEAAKRVLITLRDGTTVEGILKEETPQQIVIEEELAGGTIQQTQTILRNKIKSIVAFSQQQLAVREMEQAFQLIQRYQLNSITSYSKDYYERVINTVLRPFLERYPDSPQAEAVATKLTEWQMELRQVAAGQARYKGKWMAANEVKQVIAKQEADTLIRQARELIKRGQYEQAIERLDMVDKPEARDLVANAYLTWLRGLETERQKLNDSIITTERVLAAAKRDKPNIPLKKSLKSSEGATPQQIAAMNQANSIIRTETVRLANFRARLSKVERQYGQIETMAKKAGVSPDPVKVAATGPGGQTDQNRSGNGSSSSVVSEPISDAQSPVVARGDSDTPELLQQLRAFGLKYWPAAAVALAIGIWYVTRKFAK